MLRMTGKYAPPELRCGVIRIPIRDVVCVGQKWFSAARNYRQRAMARLECKSYKIPDPITAFQPTRIPRLPLFCVQIEIDRLSPNSNPLLSYGYRRKNEWRSTPLDAPPIDFGSRLAAFFATLVCLLQRPVSGREPQHITNRCTFLSAAL